MRLLIVSHTPHYRFQGRLTGWGPTVREIDHLAQLFDEIVHVAPVSNEPGPASSLPYASVKVRVRAVRPAGGDGMRAKLGVMTVWPRYAAAILDELRHADAVNVRCPANISMLGAVLLAVVRRPARRWIKYAGNWQPDGREPWTYSFQRWWLSRRLHRSEVTVNGSWPAQPRHIHSFLNPSLTAEEKATAAAIAKHKRLGEPVRLLYVGRLERPKGAERCLQILHAVKNKGVRAELDMVGDGSERAEFEAAAGLSGVADAVRFHGWLPRTALEPLYAAAHFAVLPATSSEGWPKALSEAMAYGAVPLAGSISSIPQYLAEFQTGRAHDPLSVAEFASSIAWYTMHPEEWRTESRRGAAVAERFTYSSYLKNVRDLLRVTGESQPVSWDKPAAQRI